MTLGKVFLVGSGPGDPELITLKGLRCLQQADVVLYDRLVHPDLLRCVSPHTLLEYVGKEEGCNSQERQQRILRRMMTLANQGKNVVRLKGGDPFVFGRGGEELFALAQAGIPVEVIPGISAAIGVPASVGIPLTYRGVSQAFGVFTGHTACGENGNHHALAARTPTAVFLMPVENLKSVSRGLIAHGRPPDTAAVVVHKGTWPEQKVWWGTLERLLHEDMPFGPPATLIVGEVVRLARSYL